LHCFDDRDRPGELSIDHRRRQGYLQRDTSHEDVVLSTLGVGTELQFCGESDMVQAVRQLTRRSVSRAGEQFTLVKCAESATDHDTSRRSGAKKLKTSFPNSALECFNRSNKKAIKS
jgi:hypothetical protein